jgi:hypothetical protein
VNGCYFPGCTGPHWGNGLCRTHNRQKASGGGFAPADAPFKIQQQYKGRWFTIGHGDDRMSAHRKLNALRAKNPDTAFRLIVGKQK